MTAKKSSRKTKPAAPALSAAEPFRLLFENHPIPMWIIDFETLAFLDANRAAVEKYGYSRDEFLRMTVQDIRPPDDMARLLEKWKQKHLPLQYAGQWRHRLKDGSLIDVEITSHTFEFNGRPVALVMAQDVTERKQAEQTLRESEGKYRQLVQRMPDAIVVYDAEGKIVLANDAAIQLMHAPSEKALLGRIAVEFVHPDYHQVVKQRMAAMRDTGEQPPLEEKLIRFDGSIVDVEVSAASIRLADQPVFQVVARDITARKRSEERLRKLSCVVEQATELVFITDRHGIIEYVNPAFERLTGYTRDEAIGQTPRILKSGQHTPDEYKELWETILAGKVFQKVLLNRKKNGELYYEEKIITPLRDERGNITHFISTGRDITARKQAEARIQEQLQTLSALYAEAQKLTENLDVQARAEEIARTGVEVFGARLAWLGRAEPDGSVRVIAHYPQEVTYPRQISVRWDDSPEGQGPTGKAIRSGRPEITEDIASDSRFAPWREAALQAGFRTSAAFPLISRGHTFGALNLYSDQPGFFDSQRVTLLLAFAQQAATALENAHLLEETRRRLERIQALRNIDMAITGSTDSHVTFNVALDEVVNQLHIDAAAILRLNPHTQTLEYTAGRGFRRRAIQKTRQRLGEGLAGRAALERRIVYIPNLPESGGQFLRATLLADEKFIAYYAVPLVAKERVLGVLELFHRSPHEGNGEWLEFLEVLGGQIAIAIDNAMLFHDLERANVNLLQAYDATIEGWSHAMDLRDKETEGHTQRVTEMTLRLARMAGFSDEELVHVRRGALLHDIGKMGVPDRILLKPGKLTDEEWAIMRQHPQFAYDMLSPIDYLRPALDIPYCHHERWDGTGYPRGLKGEQIPLAARLFAVVDVWDALCSDRPYRSGWPKEKVLEHIQSESGTHFDPEAVELFLNMQDKDEKDSG